MLSPVEDHILQALNILYLTRFRTYKIATPPQTKNDLQRRQLEIGVFQVPSSMVWVLL
jgi:hypothetical protein